MKTQNAPPVPLSVDYESIRSLETAILKVQHSRNTRINYSCAWKAFQAWCAAAGAQALPATPIVVRDFVTWCLSHGYGAHSLRSGMITEAAQNGASEASIKQRTGHRTSETLQRYIRPATAFAFNPLRGVL